MRQGGGGSVGALRLGTWNVKGQLSSVAAAPDACADVLSLLQGCDIFGLTETGCDPASPPPQLPGFWCAANLPRERRGVQGGIALFVRSGWRRHWVSVVRSNAARGTLWVRVAPPGAQPLHLGLCYMPPAESKIRGCNRAEQHRAMQADWQGFGEEACEFGRVGHVVVMGDMNARSGTAADAREVFDEEQEGGACVPPRANEDPILNAQGRCLLGMCQEADLLILNGRLPGDEHGSVTFVSSGQAGQSAVDYFLASRDMAFGVNGLARAGSALRVLPYADRPMLPANPTNPFDHSPVFCTLPLVAGMPAPARQQQQPVQGRRVVWEDSMQRDYLQCLADAGVVRLLDESERAWSVDTACERFAEGLGCAIDGLHGRGHRVFRVAGRGQPVGHKPHCNSWFNDECRTARRVWRGLVQAHGWRAPQAREARGVYVKVVRRAKRAVEDAELAAKIDEWYTSPKRFWRSFQGSRQAGPLDSDVPGWSAHFDALFQGQGAGQYEGGSFEAHLQHHAHLFDGPASASAAALLGGDISAAEVARALGMLARHKAAGPDGLPAEFLSEAFELIELDGKMAKSWVLAARIARLFTRVFEEGYPLAWGTCALTPVPKPKGDPARRDDYRGIAVSPALSKLYSLVLLNRLDPWAEKAGVRAQGQAGFRAGRGPMDNAAVLQHVCERYTEARLPMFAAFIDFRKAYDCVDRKLLWVALERLGVKGRMLSALQAMYGSVCMQVRCGGQLGVPFPAETGVRQGDPLSPLLFGLYIDRLEGWLARQCPDAGALVAGDFAAGAPAEGARLLRLLLYADDLLLMAHTHAQLQGMLDALHAFCVANRLAVNVTKSAVMVCGRRPDRMRAFQMDGRSLPECEEFVYVGVPFGPAGALPTCVDKATARAVPIIQGLHSRCAQMGVHNVMVRCSLFNSLVTPVLSYGCEVWGPPLLSKLCRAAGKWGGQGPVEQLHRSYLYRLFGVKPSAPVPAVMSAAGRVPIVHGWLARVLGFWNGIMQRPEGDVVRVALADGAGRAQRVGRAGPQVTWASGLCTALHALLPEWAERFKGGRSLPRADVLRRVKCLWHEAVWPGWPPAPAPADAAECPVRSHTDSTGFKFHTFNQWFHTEFAKGQVFAYHLHRPQHISAVSRLFFGAHDLEIERQRWVGRRVPREQRVCRICHAAVEDECHFLLECEAYKLLRNSNAAFECWGGRQPCWKYMRDVTHAGSDRKRWTGLAEFVVKAEAHRQNQLRLPTEQ